MELFMLSHLPTRVLEEGFIPAAIDLDLNITILTDCIREHLLRTEDEPLYRRCKLLECDIFNPLSIARLTAVHDLKFSGVLATGSGLQACAALIADYMGLPGPSWRSALLCDQRPMLRSHFESHSLYRSYQIVNCAEPATDIDASLFPVSVQSLESDLATGGTIVRTPQELEHWLAKTRHGYALVEKHREGEVYTLDELGTADGFVVLGGSHIRFDDDARRTKRIHSFMEKPPRCDELLVQLSRLDLGLGRHHVEYAVTETGIHIREIHNGLHNDAYEFAVNAQLDGDLFRATIKVCLGMPVKPLRLACGSTRHSAVEAAL